MLVLFSDIHITDATTSTNVAPEAFEILKDEIISNAKDSQAKEIRIVPIGDIFDLMRTDYWLKLPNEERPWNGIIDLDTGMNNNSKLMETHFNNVLDSILATQSADAFFNMIKCISDEFKDNIPVNVNYVIGNHDRALNIFDSLRTKIKAKCAQIAEFTFCNKIDDDNYAVLCRHGHEFDESNYSYDLYRILQKEKGVDVGLPNRFDENITKVMSIGEVITSELMSGLIFVAKNNGGDNNFIKLVKEINNVRPMTNVFVWLYWASQAMNTANKEILINSFRTCVENVLNTKFSECWRKTGHGLWIFKDDLVDHLRLLLEIVEHKDFDKLSKIVDVYNIYHKEHDKFFQPKPDSLYEGAKSEFDSDAYRNKQYILYGHTHEPRNDYVSGSVDGTAKMYINTGTYLPYIESADRNNTFASAYQMILCFLYRTDEDTNGTTPNGFPTLDLWNGIKRKRYN